VDQFAEYSAGVLYTANRSSEQCVDQPPPSTATHIWSTVAQLSVIHLWWCDSRGRYAGRAERGTLLSDVKTLVSVSEAELARSPRGHTGCGQPSEFEVNVPPRYEVTESRAHHSIQRSARPVRWY